MDVDTDEGIAIMNAQRIVLAAAIGVMLVGCSDLATKDAPIEERSKVQAGVPTKGATAAGTVAEGTATAGAATAPGATPAGAQTAGTGATDVASAAPLGQGVQTHGTSSQGVEARPLPGGVASGPGEAAAGAAGGTAAAVPGGEAAGAAARFAGMRSPPKDVAGPLSKRVIYFDYDSSVIKDEYRDIVQAHAEFLRASKEAKSVLQGHTDERGSRDYNLALGQRRAESVQQSLNLLGVEAAKLEAVSLGEEKPVKEGHDEESWSKNRRVEIYYQGE